MIILGIDPGTTKAGFGVIKKTKKGLRCLDYGIISVPKDFPHEERLKRIHREILKILNKHKPLVFCIESLFFFKNLKTAVLVSEARGVMILAAAQKKIKIKTVSPLQVKMTISGYGRAHKGQIQKLVKEILRMEEIPKPDDAADGLAIAITASRFAAGD